MTLCRGPAGPQGSNYDRQTVSDSLLLVLRICLLALVYLTFLRVLRAVWAELRAEHRVAAASAIAVPMAVTGSSGGSPGAEIDERVRARIVVVAPASAAGSVFEIQGEAIIGRAPGCEVVIDDARVSKLHARVVCRGGRWVVEDLGSTNGTLLNDRVVATAVAIGPGDRVQVADHVLELV